MLWIDDAGSARALGLGFVENPEAGAQASSALAARAQGFETVATAFCRGASNVDGDNWWRSPGPWLCLSKSIPWQPSVERKHGDSCFRVHHMATPPIVGKPPPAPIRPTRYYFAYGSNIHLKQMGRRCPNSKYIGRARLSNYRWQINQRGYANVAEAEGHWVDGLVFEIDENDEARLDVNEGVSKNAYSKLYMPVLLYRAQSALYRRPTSWIVDKGGPAKVCRLAKPEIQKPAGNQKYWQKDVLVYANLTHIEDSQPKEEYVKRINLAIADALALGVEDDYIRNCIRPFIPAPNGVPKQGEASVSGQKPNETTTTPPEAKPRTGEPSSARKGPVPAGIDKQTSHPLLTRLRNNAVALTKMYQQIQSLDTPPPLPPRPTYQVHEYPIIVVEEFQYNRTG
ncbi:hypothetical protein HJFPF1_04816 [Paramyrothecium foliicola]|nr:hypothetical protein HJFPF1_04816 [Paramyrothecium foliicola]